MALLIKTGTVGPTTAGPGIFLAGGEASKSGMPDCGCLLARSDGREYRRGHSHSPLPTPWSPLQSPFAPPPTLIC